MLLIGIGDCGCGILEEHIDGCKLLAVESSDSFEKPPVETIRVKAADEIRQALPPYLENISQVIIVVGLGGRFGSSIAPVVAGVVNRKGISIQVIATMPFDFEGTARREKADNALELLKDLTPVTVFDNEALIGQGHEDLKAAYAHVHEKAKNIIEAAIKTTPSTTIH